MLKLHENVLIYIAFILRKKRKKSDNGHTRITIWIENRKHSHAGKYLTIKQWGDSCSLEGQKIGISDVKVNF